LCLLLVPQVFSILHQNFLGVKPIEINSSLLSAQNRRRLYWTNIPNIKIPEDKGILLKDIVHENVDADYSLSEGRLAWFKKNAENQLKNKYSALSPSKAITMTARQDASWNQNYIFEYVKEFIVPFNQTLQILDKEIEQGKVGYFNTDSQGNRVYYIHDKAVTLCGEAGGLGAKTGLYLFGCITPDRVYKRQNGARFNEGNKFYTLTAQDKHGILIEGYIRKLTPIECERLQTVPDNYTDGVSNNQRYKMLGNGWTIDVISHILSHIPEKKIENVLSLFDGMSCGQLALKRSGIEYSKYYASEIDKYTISITKKHFPNTIHIGDITNIDWNLLNIELFCLSYF